MDSARALPLLFRRETLMKALFCPFFSFSSPILQSFRFSGICKTSVSSLLSSLQQSGNVDTSNATGGLRQCLSTEAEALFECEVDQPYANDGKLMEKDAALHLALSRLSGDFNRESMLSLRRFSGSRYVPVISTGSLKLDLALGVGGLPKGRMVEIYGQEASGKTTLALHIVKEAQKNGGYCAYIDVENAMDPTLAESIGVDTENLLIARPNCAENSLSVVDTLVKSGSLDVIVVDSVAALVPQYELDNIIDLTGSELQTRLMKQGLRKVQHSLSRSQTVLVFVNQIRSNLRMFQGFEHASEATCGGNALKFYAAVRMRIMRKGLLKTADEVTGLNIIVQVVKNKLAPAMKKAELAIGFGKGIYCEAEVLELACKHGVICRTENGYLIDGQIFRYKLDAEQYLVENEGVVDDLVRAMRSLFFESNS